MGKYFILAITFVAVLGTGSGWVHIPDQAAAKDTRQLYTAYNIWRHPSHNMKCINWKGGSQFIPAGTPVSKVKVKKERDVSNYEKEYIYFKVEGERFNIKIGFKQRYHPGKRIRDYVKLMFTEKTFEELTAAMTRKEVAAIKAGILVEGMGKEAVLVSYGYPPEHATNHLRNDTWHYWINKREKKTICFNQFDKTIQCHKQRSKGLLDQPL